MSIWHRVYNILRANLNRPRPEPPSDSGFSSSAEDPFRSESGWGDDTRYRSGDRRESTADTGPPPGQDPKLAQYYANLEVPYGSDLKTVKAAWKSLLRKYHPDLHSKDPEKKEIAEELTQGLNHAYSELEKRLKQSADGGG